MERSSREESLCWNTDFTKAFDTVSHNMLLQKLNDLGIRGDFLLWIKNCLTERRQFVRINGCDSDTHIMTHGVPQGSVLGPTLFSLFTNDLPKSLRSAETYLYADDTTIYCIAETMNLLTNTLNHALAELQKWCDSYMMVPHPEKCKAMIVQRQSSFIGPIQALRLGNKIIEWTTSERLLGVQVDDKLCWSDHAANVAKSFASKLSLLRRMRFLPRKQLEDFYTKVILPSVTYDLTVWGSCNKMHLNNLEKLHARAGRIVHGLPWDTSAEDVGVIDRFSNRTGTAFEDGISRGIVWTRLPVSLLTSSGQVHVTFMTAFSLFSRREDNVKGGKTTACFCLYFSWKR